MRLLEYNSYDIIYVKYLLKKSKEYYTRGEIKVTTKIFFIAPIGTNNSVERKCSDFILWILKEYLERVSSRKQDNYVIERYDTGEEGNSSLIMNGIIKNIMDCDLAIAFLEFNKPNVFYEVALTHSIGKKCILIASEDYESPFDIFDEYLVRIDNFLYEKIIENSENKELLDELYSNSDPISEKVETHKFRTICKELANKIIRIIDKPIESNSVLRASNQLILQQNNYLTISQLLNDVFNATGIKGIIERSATAEYIEGEGEAFTALTESINQAKKSVRTTRFANQSICSPSKENEYNLYYTKFMNSIYNFSKNNQGKDVICDRIVCNNNHQKWYDIYQTLCKTSDNMRVFVRKAEHDIYFEMVVIDEKIVFIHFYDSPKEGRDTRKIRSTVKITGDAIGKRFADIFDRLHHKYERDEKLSSTVFTEFNCKETEQEARAYEVWNLFYKTINAKFGEYEKKLNPTDSDFNNLLMMQKGISSIRNFDVLFKERYLDEESKTIKGNLPVII